MKLPKLPAPPLPNALQGRPQRPGDDKRTVEEQVPRTDPLSRDRKRAVLVEVGDGQIGAQPAVGPGIGDHQWGLVGDDVLAERVRQRGLAARGPGFGQPDRADEHLPVDVDQRVKHRPAKRAAFTISRAA